MTDALQLKIDKNFPSIKSRFASMKLRTKRPPSSAAAAAVGMFVILVTSPPPMALISESSSAETRTQSGWLFSPFPSPLLLVEATPTSQMLTDLYASTSSIKYNSGFVANTAKTKMYAVPYFSGEKQVLELDATAGLEVKINKLETEYPAFSYITAVLIPRQDKIYAAPYNADRFLEIDPATGTAKTIDHDLADGQLYKYRGCSTPLTTTSSMYCKFIFYLHF